MKRITVLSILLCISNIVWGQYICGHEPSSPIRLTGNENIANGGVFTPKGNLRILVVFISYGNEFDYQDLKDGQSILNYPYGQRLLIKRFFMMIIQNFHLLQIGSPIRIDNRYLISITRCPMEHSKL